MQLPIKFHLFQHTKVSFVRSQANSELFPDGLVYVSR
jgi:hypothetical protein